MEQLLNWAEKIIALPAWVISATYAGLFAVSAISIELAPFSWTFLLASFAAFLSNGAILYWLSALHVVARSRQSTSAAQEGKERGLFLSALVWTTIWCVAAPLLTIFARPLQWFLFLAPTTLVVGYFFLRALWATVSALAAFECSPRTFQTFLQVLYFPIGVWFLQPRLQALLSAPRQHTANVT
jgi:hypothetical protein